MSLNKETKPNLLSAGEFPTSSMALHSALQAARFFRDNLAKLTLLAARNLSIFEI